jgi:hypothetical protein
MALVALAIVVAGCSSAKTSPPALAPYARQTLTAGRGLGDIRLGEMTLQAFGERFGSGRPALVAGDTFGVELTFCDGQVGFLFVAEGAADSRLRWSAPREAVSKLNDLEKFFAAFPECRAIPLHSISVAAGESPETTWFKGTTGEGTALFAPLEAVGLAYGKSHDVRGILLAGASPADDRYTYVTYDSGVAFHADPGYATAEGESSRRLVRKIAIFRPEP